MKCFALACVATLVAGICHAELQFVCTYGSDVQVFGTDPENPKIKIKPGREKYGFYIDEKSGKAEYLNFAFGAKNLIATAGSSNMMLVLTEVTTADNHFTATIFLKMRADGLYPSVFSQHSWIERSDVYRPSMKIGNCSKL